MKPTILHGQLYCEAYVVSMKDEIKKEITEKLLQYYKHGKWKSIINLFHEEVREGNENFYDERYLWVRPSENNLQFIKQQTVKAGCCQLVSIGCGTGLLEWLIHKATGLEVTGIEVDRGWWESSHAPPIFLPLIYADETHGSDITTNKNAALLFCYFNNGSAFSEYMRQYEGNCFIVIGPGEGRGTHTQPAPFNIQLESEFTWKLEAFQEVQCTKDFIAVYVKSQSELEVSPSKIVRLTQQDHCPFKEVP